MQSPDFSQNYFELFGLSEVFEIDTAQLQSSQQRLQASFHPDRFAGSSEQQKRLSVQTAAWINQAFETLRDPVKRARYLLQLNGAELPDDAATTSDTEFLMEQMELREQVESCRSGENALERCEQIENRLRQRAAELGTEFVAQLEQEDYAAALNSSLKMQFIQRIQQQLAEIKFDLEDF